MEPRVANIMKNSERVAWLLIGGAVGAGIALLYAPQSGSETRKLIRRKAEDAKDVIVERGGQVRDTLVETGESVVDAGRGAYRKGASMAASAAESATSIFEKGRRVVRG
jgi:gas vesicle protein